MAAPHVPSMLEQHRSFAALTSLGFAVLYAELGVFAHLRWRARSHAQATVLISTIFCVTLVAFVASFVPAKSFTVEGVERQGSLVLPQLAEQMGRGVLYVLAASAIALAVCVYLVGGELVATYTLLINIYVYTLAGAGLLHGIVSYVRYAALLYSLGQASWIKVLVVSGGLGVLMLLASLCLFAVDIKWLAVAPLAQRGLVGVHVYGRDLYFFTLVLAIYVWHARWMAQH